MTTIADLSVKIAADITGLKTGLTQANNSLGEFARSAGDKIGDFGGNLALLSAPLGAMGIAAISAGISFESAFADVRKTVSASEVELMALQSTLRDMATDDSNPVSSLDNALLTLTSVSAAAGQLGVETENIASFSQTMSYLGVATNLTAEEAAVFSARFKNVTGMSFDKIDELADTLVTLGNNMATTESEIATFATRLAPLANFEWEPDKILGYSAALSSLGVSAELGGTNLTKSVSDMTTAVAMGGPELEGFAAIAGSTADEFKKLADSNPELAFFSFIEGLSKMDASDQILQLNALGISSVEQIGTLQRLAGGFDTLTQSLELAQGAWVGNNAALNEATAKAATTEGDLNRLKNQLFELGVSASAGLLPVIKDLAGALSPIITGITDWVNKNPELTGQILAASVGAMALGGAMVVLGPILGAVGTAIGLLLAPLGLLVVALTFADWPQIGEGIGQVADGLGRIVAGDASGWETVKTGLTDIGVGLFDIPLGILNTVMDGLEKITGLQLPEYNWEGVMSGLKVLGDGLARVWDDIMRGLDIFLLDSRLSIMAWLDGLRTTIKNGTGIDIAPNLVVDTLAMAEQARDLKLTNRIGDILRAQVQSGTGIDLMIETGVIEIGPGMSIDGGSLLELFTPGSKYYDEIVANAGVGTKQAIRDALLQAMYIDDTYTVEMLTPLAVALGIDVASVTTQVEAYLTSIDPAATLMAAITISPVMQNLEAFVNTVRNALTAQPIAASVQAMISVSPILSGVASAISAVISAITAATPSGATASIPPPTDGSHAGGLDYVPFDNYVGNLHRGEAVLTAGQAAEWRGGRGGQVAAQNTFNLHSYGQSPQEFAEWIRRLMAEGSY